MNGTPNVLDQPEAGSTNGILLESGIGESARKKPSTRTRHASQRRTHAPRAVTGEFARVTDTRRDAIKSAINSAIRQGILSYEGSVVWRVD